MSLKIAFKLSLIMIPFQVINSVLCECVSGGVFTSGECRMAGLIISTIKGKYIQLHPGQVLMKDSRQAGLFHLSSVVGQYPHLRTAALLCFCSEVDFEEKVKNLIEGLVLFFMW